MSQFSDYTAGIKDRLTAKGLVAGSKLAGITIVTEDAKDLGTEIDKALEEVGMLILVGEPPMENTQQSVRIANMKITSAIAVGEVPDIWRDVPLTKPTAIDVVQAVVEGLQGFTIEGFQPLRVLRADVVPHKTRKLWEVAIESQTIVEGER